MWDYVVQSINHRGSTWVIVCGRFLGYKHSTALTQIHTDIPAVHMTRYTHVYSITHTHTDACAHSHTHIDEAFACCKNVYSRK